MRAVISLAALFWYALHEHCLTCKFWASSNSQKTINSFPLILKKKFNE